MLTPSLAALFLFAVPDALIHAVLAQPGITCKITYHCCVERHPYDAAENCNHLQDTPTLPQKAPPRPEPVKTAEPVKAPEPSPTRQPEPPGHLGPDIFVLPQGEPEEAVRRTGDSKPAPKLPPPKISVFDEAWERLYPASHLGGRAIERGAAGPDRTSRQGHRKRTCAAPISADGTR